MQFTFKEQSDTIPITNQTKITYETSANCLPDILEDFARFLRACGFTVGELIEEVEE